MNNILDQLNQGKPVKTVEGSTGEKLILEITQVMFREDEKLKDKEGNPAIYMEMFVSDVSNSEKETQIRQYINFDKDGNLRNPAYPGYVKNGESKPCSVVYEIMQRAKALNEKDYEERKEATADPEGGRRWKEFLEGLKFEIECLSGARKDGTGGYLIPQTEYQKARDERKRKQEAVKVEVPVSEINTDDLPF